MDIEFLATIFCSFDICFIFLNTEFYVDNFFLYLKDTTSPSSHAHSFHSEISLYIFFFLSSGNIPFVSSLKIFFFSAFVQLDSDIYDMMMFNFLHAFYAWGMLDSLDLQLHNCHQIWKVFGLYFLKYLYVTFPILSSYSEM